MKTEQQNAPACVHNYKLKPPTYNRQEKPQAERAITGQQDWRMRQAERATTRIADTDFETAAGAQEEGTGWKQLAQQMKYTQTGRRIGAAARVCRQHQKETGCDIYRQLCHRYVIPPGTRSIGYLTNVLQPTSDLNNSEDIFSLWEFEFPRVEQDHNTTPTDHVKVAETPEPLQHLQLL